MSSNTSSSSLDGLVEESIITNTRSACSILFLDLSTPIFSIESSLCLIPAVSNRCKVIPLRLISPSTTSLVVPGILVTIAFSSPNKAFNKDDLPTFGLPTMATLIPSLIILAFSASLINSLISFTISLHEEIIFSLLAISISSYSG